MKHVALCGVWLAQGRWSFGAKIAPLRWIDGVQVFNFKDGARLITVHFGPLEFALGRKVAAQ